MIQPSDVRDNPMSMLLVFVRFVDSEDNGLFETWVWLRPSVGGWTNTEEIQWIYSEAQPAKVAGVEVVYPWFIRIHNDYRSRGTISKGQTWAIPVEGLNLYVEGNPVPPETRRPSLINRILRR